jgi:NAD-dependent SIR2 family protein deacetylase
MFGKLECFNCSAKTSKSKAYTVELNTAEGKHKLTLCEECGKNFNSVAVELEEILNERPNSI